LDHDALLALFRRIALATAPLVVGCGSTFESGCTSQPETTTTVLLSSFVHDGSADDGGTTDGGVAELCSEAVPSQRIVRCQLVTVDGGSAVRVTSTPYCLGGRRPAGLAVARELRRESELGTWLASLAHLEAASVDAFQIMAAELRDHGAPSARVRAALSAARDEQRHARLMGRLAVRHGARPAAARVRRRPTRELEAVATENAVEGCVRETFAALVAWRQTRTASLPDLRRSLRGIAPDETRHAALSWEVDAWSREKLGPAARRRIDEARRSEIASLRRDLTISPTQTLRDAAGLPGGDEAVAMASALFASLARTGG
jgi:hypothetical protein